VDKAEQIKSESATPRRTGASAEARKATKRPLRPKQKLTQSFTGNHRESREDGAENAAEPKSRRTGVPNPPPADAKVDPVSPGNLRLWIRVPSDQPRTRRNRASQESRRGDEAETDLTAVRRRPSV